MSKLKPDTKRVLVFLALAFGISWAVWALETILGIREDNPLVYLFSAAAVLGPGIGAMIACRKTMGVRKFLKYSFTFDQKLSYYAVFLAFALWRYFLCMAVGERVEGSTLYLPLLLIPVCIFTGGNEEFGWRGYLQPVLEKKMGAVSTTFIITGIWAAWHIPLWFMPIDPRSTLFEFLIFIGFILTNTFTLAAIYKLTGSVLFCVLFHTWINAISNTFMPTGDWKTIAGFVLEWAVSLVILILCEKGVFKTAKPRFPEEACA